MNRTVSRLSIVLLAVFLTSCSGAMALRVKSGSSMLYGYVEGGDLGPTLSAKFRVGSPTGSTMRGRGTGKAFYVLNAMPDDYYVESINLGVRSVEIDRMRTSAEDPGRPWGVRIHRAGFHYIGAIELVESGGKLIARPIKGPGRYAVLAEIYEKLEKTPWGEEIGKELERLEKSGY